MIALAPVSEHWLMSIGPLQMRLVMCICLH